MLGVHTYLFIIEKVMFFINEHHSIDVHLNSIIMNTVHLLMRMELVK